MKKLFLLCAIVGGTQQLLADQVVHIERFIRPDSLNRSGEVLLTGGWHYRVSLRDEWHPIQVPHVLRSQGQYTFRRFFTLDSLPSGGNYRLLFENIEGISTIYLNRKELARRPWTSAPIILDVAKQDLFFNGRNELIVDLDTRVNYKTTLPHSVRSRGLPPIAGGLTRPVKLIYGQAPCLVSMSVQENPAVTAVRLLLYRGQPDTLVQGADRLLSWQIELFAADRLAQFQSEVMAIPDTTTILQTTVSLPLAEGWRPRQPERYRLRATLYRAGEAIDRAEMVFGRGGTKWSERWQAIEWQEDYHIQELSEKVLNDRIEADMQAIYGAGANSVRVLGNAPPERLLSVCDQLGLAVFLDVPLINIPSRHLAKSEIKKRAEQLIRVLIQLGRDHPCVAGWGLGNGYSAHDAEAISFLLQMRQVVKELDSRPVYAGFRGERPLPSQLPVDLAIWETRPEHINQLTVPRHRTSYPVVYRLTAPLSVGPISESAAEQNQAFQLKRAITLCLQAENLNGVLISPWRDFWGDTPHLMWGDRENANLFTAGLLNKHSEPRRAYQLVASLFSATPLPELLPVEVVQPDPYIFQALGLVLLVAILFYVKQDKRMNHYVRRAFFYPHGFYMDLVENRQLSPFLTGLVGVVCFLSLSAILTSFVYFYRTNSYVDEWLSWLFPSAKMKYHAIWLIWHPAAMIPLMTVVLELLTLLQAVLIKMTVLWQRRYLRFTQIVTFVHWVPASFLFSLPLVVMLYRSLEKGYLVQVWLLLLLILGVWFLLRSFRGLKVILQTTAMKTLLYLITLIGGSVLLLLLLFEPSRSIWAYLQYYGSLLAR